LASFFLRNTQRAGELEDKPTQVNVWLSANQIESLIL
jgi:hypothetical protein